jgi:hypothetical protein
MGAKAVCWVPQSSRGARAAAQWVVVRWRLDYNHTVRINKTSVDLNRSALFESGPNF